MKYSLKKAVGGLSDLSCDWPPSRDDMLTNADTTKVVSAKRMRWAMVSLFPYFPSLILGFETLTVSAQRRWRVLSRDSSEAARAVLHL
jgi:hypothetical protein